MKRIKLFIGMGKITICVVTSYLVTLATSQPVFATQVTLPSGESIELDAPLTGELQSRFGDGWARAFYIEKNGARLQLFQEEQLTRVGGIVFEAIEQKNVSPTGHYIVVPVIRQGLLDVAGEKSRIEGREYCPVIEAATGCIITMQTGEICGGGWASKRDIWLDSSDDRSSEMTTKTTAGANSMWHEFSRASVKLKLRDVIARNLGVSNVMACDPPNLENRKSYLALAKQLRQENARSEASLVESKVALLSATGAVSGQMFRIRVEKAWLYESPSSNSKTKMYIVRGDQVTAVDVLGDEWVKIDFQQASGHMLRKWIRASDIMQR
ncbi:hypothetical protein HHL24_29215 [Paraburkholderia sp. RP-4-7]|uniref:SH3 domain-containing protein n=1 Tax=Paraburkholderia polaris TaxID=2728848 RepID=A0A848IP81_9BURK|nr:hypothetical protein [Paraburkholderia polaris]NMM01999.1 hypothetical protein [Paraburkholderia polaris]